MDDELERIIESLIDLLVDDYYRERSTLVWEALWLEGNYKLIETLRLAELGVLTVVIVPDRGFSKYERVHDLVCHWCLAHKIDTLHVASEIESLELACTWRTSHF